MWESNAAFATDFQIYFERSLEIASLQVSVSSQDSYENDVPLAIPHRIPVIWQPGNSIAGVHRIRDAWESNEAHKPPKKDRKLQKSDLSLPLQELESKSSFHRSVFARLSRERRALSPSEFRSGSPHTVFMSSPAPIQDKNWNVVSSPTSSETARNDPNELPKWANESGGDFGEVVVV